MQKVYSVFYIKSITGKILGEIFQMYNDFAFSHHHADICKYGFASAEDARSAFLDFHEEYLECQEVRE